MKQKVLIMGGSYFIGKRIVEAFLEHDDSVYILNRGSRLPEDERIVQLFSDRNDEGQMKKILTGLSFDVVVDVSGLNQTQAKILCESLDTSSLKKVIFISSSAVYDVENLQAPFTENDPLKENHYWTTYGQDKIEAEQYYINYFFNQHTSELIILRPPYVYGENNYAKRESFIFEHLDHQKPIIIPSSNPKLQFIYTADLAHIVLNLISCDLEKLSIFNVGNQQAVTTREWIDACAKVANQSAHIIEYNYQQDKRSIRDFFPFYDYDNVLDVTKIKQLIPIETDFEAGLKQAYNWYLENKNDIAFKEDVARNEVMILERNQKSRP